MKQNETRHETVSADCARKLREVLDTMEEEKYDQNTWCGTECCFAGHILAVHGDKKEKWVARSAQLHRLEESIVTTAARLVEAPIEIQDIFDSSDAWPVEYRDSRTGRVTLSHLIKRVEDFISKDNHARSLVQSGIHRPGPQDSL